MASCVDQKICKEHAWGVEGIWLRVSLLETVEKSEGQMEFEEQHHPESVAAVTVLWARGEATAGCRWPHPFPRPQSDLLGRIRKANGWKEKKTGWLGKGRTGRRPVGRKGVWREERPGQPAGNQVGSGGRGAGGVCSEAGESRRGSVGGNKDQWGRWSKRRLGRGRKKARGGRQA